MDLKYKSYNGDCTEVMKQFDDESVDVILTDPPYLYLKNQKLDKPFDEETFFNEAKRVLKKDGFMVLFGRGTSFYRWNTMLAELGFTFKEEFIWDKGHNTSPLMPISRVHETISLHTKGKGTINKVKVPYLEMKGHDIPSICQDIKRLRSILKNTQSLDAVLNYLDSNQDRDSMNEKSIKRTDIDNEVMLRRSGATISSDISDLNRCGTVIRMIDKGMREKSIVRTDFEPPKNLRKGCVVRPNAESGDRACNVFQSVSAGMNEKTIIKQGRDHYKSIHPTQKPVRLLERLLQLVLPEDIEKPIIVLDPFAGSFATGLAAVNLGCCPVLIELDKEYYNGGKERLDEYIDEMGEELKSKENQLKIAF